jgi:hypothetical protein
MLPYGVAMIARVRGAVTAAVVLGMCCGCQSAAVDRTATELAESQISATTVIAPAPPDPCDPRVIEVQAADPGGDADQVIDLVNRGDVSCEVDVGSSPGADRDLEPNVVLGPGEVAHLWISERPGCESTRSDPMRELELSINGVSRFVPLTFVSTCDIELWAFFTD